MYCLEWLRLARASAVATCLQREASARASVVLCSLYVSACTHVGHLVRADPAVVHLCCRANQPGGRQDGNRWVVAIFQWAYSMEVCLCGVRN